MDYRRQAMEWEMYYGLQAIGDGMGDVLWIIGDRRQGMGDVLSMIGDRRQGMGDVLWIIGDRRWNGKCIMDYRRQAMEWEMYYGLQAIGDREWEMYYR